MKLEWVELNIWLWSFRFNALGAVDGIREAYTRMGNESVPVPDYMLHELILRGTNRTYDVISTEHLRKDYSFTLLEATYLQRTKVRFEETDYVSFGLVTADGHLTRAGALLTDQHIVYNSRLFCTRWNGLDKGSIFDDALDDKEFEGNLIYLLQNGQDFIKVNSKMRFTKEARERVDKPDYAERAATECLVNALIHRDYIVMGAEIHIDMFDDRVEISSPGGMYEGPAIQEQDIENIKSERRNPIIADLFHRMRYMERRGSGLKKIVNETAKLPGYSKEHTPVFHSTISSFSVVLKNVNFRTEGINGGINDSINDGINGRMSSIESRHIKIIDLIKSNPTITLPEIQSNLDISESTLERDIATLKKQNKVKRVGSRKTGYWELL